MTLNWAVVAFLDFSSGAAVGGASVSSRVGTAGSFGRGRSVGLRRAGQTEEIIATPVAARPGGLRRITPACPVGLRTPGMDGRRRGIIRPRHACLRRARETA